MALGHDVTLLGLKHKETSYEEATPEVRGKVIESNFQIAKSISEISKGNPAIVFEETVPGDDVYDFQTIDVPHLRDLKIVGQQFRQKFPTKVADLTELQRRVLYTYGGVYVALMSGSASELRGTGRDGDEDHRVQQKYSAVLEKMKASGMGEDQAIQQIWSRADFIYDVHTRREEQALEQVAGYLKRKPSGTVPIFLVFGYKHDFKESGLKFPTVRLRRGHPSSSPQASDLQECERALGEKGQ